MNANMKMNSKTLRFILKNTIFTFDANKRNAFNSNTHCLLSITEEEKTNR